MAYRAKIVRKFNHKSGFSATAGDGDASGGVRLIGMFCVSDSS